MRQRTQTKWLLSWKELAGHKYLELQIQHREKRPRHLRRGVYRLRRREAGRPPTVTEAR